MQLYSTNDSKNIVSLKEAVLNGLPKDRGLYMPVHIPRLDKSIIENIDAYSFQDISFELCKALFDGYMSEQDIIDLIEKSLVFEAPLVNIGKNINILELFHGPSLAFKDFGARFMAQLMSYLIRDDKKDLTILVATSGDTGGAVAQGFYKTQGIKVVILYPSGKVSDLQEKQLTTLGENITALEIDGTFDDCQAMVKDAFLDEELKAFHTLSSANSINIARLIPQMFYYFRAYQQLLENHRNQAVFVVPSGNFGNLTAGLLAKKMGLPVRKFIAATNINDVVPQYLATGRFQSRKSVQTISNAMDIGNPSNFVRMLDLFNHDRDQMAQEIQGYSFNDHDTRTAIRQIYDQNEYIIDPHGAVGYLAFQEYAKNDQEATGIILETAHPAKFLDVVEAEVDQKVIIPERLGVFSEKEKEATFLPANYAAFKDFLIKLK